VAPEVGIIPATDFRVVTNVLIADDERSLVENLSTYLGSFAGQFSVRTAGSGEEALRVLEHDPTVQVLLTDVHMPGIDGIEVTRRARQLRPGLGVVVMTAYGSPGLRALAMQLGARNLLEKPLDLEELRTALLEAQETDHAAFVRKGPVSMASGSVS
jgi:CheY-like chemotaxis protein